MSTTDTPTRPKRTDPQVLEETAIQLAPNIATWCDDDPPAEAIVPQLKKALRWGGVHDGYAIARELDSFLDPDSGLVEILNEAAYISLGIHRKLCEKWVVDHGLTGPEVGSRVKETAPSRQADKGIGIVVRNEPDGTAVVSFPDQGDMGHVPESERPSGGIRVGTYIAWENLVPA